MLAEENFYTYVFLDLNGKPICQPVLCTDSGASVDLSSPLAKGTWDWMFAVPHLPLGSPQAGLAWDVCRRVQTLEARPYSRGPSEGLAAPPAAQALSPSNVLKGIYEMEQKVPHGLHTNKVVLFFNLLPVEIQVKEED